MHVRGKHLSATLTIGNAHCSPGPHQTILDTANSPLLGSGPSKMQDFHHNFLFLDSMASDSSLHGTMLTKGSSPPASPPGAAVDCGFAQRSQHILDSWDSAMFGPPTVTQPATATDGEVTISVLPGAERTETRGTVRQEPQQTTDPASKKRPPSNGTGTLERYMCSGARAISSVHAALRWKACIASDMQGESRAGHHMWCSCVTNRVGMHHGAETDSDATTAGSSVRELSSQESTRSPKPAIRSPAKQQRNADWNTGTRSRKRGETAATAKSSKLEAAAAEQESRAHISAAAAYGNTSAGPGPPEAEEPTPQNGKAGATQGKASQRRPLEQRHDNGLTRLPEPEKVKTVQLSQIPRIPAAQGRWQRTTAAAEAFQVC